jgi:hypothetical protein
MPVALVLVQDLKRQCCWTGGLLPAYCRAELVKHLNSSNCMTRMPPCWCAPSCENRFDQNSTGGSARFSGGEQIFRTKESRCQMSNAPECAFLTLCFSGYGA